MFFETNHWHNIQTPWTRAYSLHDCPLLIHSDHTQTQNHMISTQSDCHLLGTVFDNHCHSMIEYSSTNDPCPFHWRCRTKFHMIWSSLRISLHPYKNRTDNRFCPMVKCEKSHCP